MIVVTLRTNRKLFRLGKSFHVIVLSSFKYCSKLSFNTFHRHAGINIPYGSNRRPANCNSWTSVDWGYNKGYIKTQFSLNIKDNINVCTLSCPMIVFLEYLMNAKHNHFWLCMFFIRHFLSSVTSTYPYPLNSFGT